jgi:phospholipase C
VKGVFAYFSTLSYKPFNNCESNHYYLLNNYNPGYNVDGSLNLDVRRPATAQLADDRR